MSYIIKPRRGLKKDLPVLNENEIGITTDTHEIFVGTSEGNVKLGVEDAPQDGKQYVRKDGEWLVSNNDVRIKTFNISVETIGTGKSLFIFKFPRKDFDYQFTIKETKNDNSIYRSFKIKRDGRFVWDESIMSAVVGQVIHNKSVGYFPTSTDISGFITEIYGGNTQYLGDYKFEIYGPEWLKEAENIEKIEVEYEPRDIYDTPDGWSYQSNLDFPTEITPQRREQTLLEGLNKHIPKDSRIFLTGKDETINMDAQGFVGTLNNARIIMKAEQPINSGVQAQITVPKVEFRIRKTTGTGGSPVEITTFDIQYTRNNTTIPGIATMNERWSAPRVMKLYRTSVSNGLMTSSATFLGLVLATINFYGSSFTNLRITFTKLDGTPFEISTGNWLILTDF